MSLGLFTELILLSLYNRPTRTLVVSSAVLIIIAFLGMMASDVVAEAVSAENIDVIVPLVLAFGLLVFITLFVALWIVKEGENAKNEKPIEPSLRGKDF